jgi:hypothetical protein
MDMVETATLIRAKRRAANDERIRLVIIANPGRCITDLIAITGTCYVALRKALGRLLDAKKIIESKVGTKKIYRVS